MREFTVWFDWRPGGVRRLFALLLLLFASGTYMYVWCELFTPGWYAGRFSSRFGALPLKSSRLVLEREGC